MSNDLVDAGGHPPLRQPVGDAGRDPVTGKNKPHKRDDKTAGQVEAMTALGLTVEEIAVQLDLRPGQIRKHYAREIETAMARANMQVAKAVFDLAKSGQNVAASMFWLRNRAGWQDKQQVEHTGKLGLDHAGKITVQVVTGVPRAPNGESGGGSEG